MAMDYFLKEINPSNDATPLKIFLDRNETIIGRRSIISLTGFNKVSRKHAKFLNKNGRWFISDLESLNKLYVNFKEVGSDWKPLEIGDIIGFGTPTYFEDGGFVCVFAANHRIKQEVIDETESPNFPTKSTGNVQNIVTEKDLTVKQELPFCEEGDLKIETEISKSECIPQIDVYASSNVLNNISQVTKAISGSVTDQSDLLASRKKQEYGPNKLKLEIKTEPNETDTNELLGVKNISSNENLSINQKQAVEHKGMFDDSNTTICEVKFSLQNKIEERKELPIKDENPNIRKINMSSRNHCNQDNEKADTNGLIPENEILESSNKLQGGKCIKKQKDKDVKHFSKKMKSCSVKLVRCDSKYFRWPPEINFPKLFETERNQKHFSEHSVGNTFQDKTIKETNCLLANRQQNFTCHQKRKMLKDGNQKRKSSIEVSVNLKINKNRIVSSSSEMSNIESECERDSSTSNNIASYKKRIKMKFKKHSRDKKNIDLCRQDNSSSDETSEALKVSEKRKQCFSDFASNKRKRHKKEYENRFNLRDSEYFKLQSSSSVSKRKANIRNSRILSYSRDESSFYVERQGCSKYWTPEYNEFETGEVRESWKSNTFIKPRQTAGRTLLTDPKPIEYRPKRMRGREEWFKEQSSYICRDRDKKERISENVDEETSFLSKRISKMSSLQRWASLKKNSFVDNRKISPQVNSNSTSASRKGNSLVANQKSSTELTSSKTLPEPPINFSNPSQKNVKEFSRETLQTAKENASTSGRKNSKELSLIETLAASSGNSLIISQGTSREPLSKKSSDEPSLIETLAATSGNSLINRRNSIELSSRENPSVESKEKSMKEKLDNSVLTKSAEVTIQMNTVSSVPKPLNGSGCHTRFLVEIHTNVNKASKYKHPIAKETLPQYLEKRGCSASSITNSTKDISGLVTVEATTGEKKDMNNAVATVSPNRRSVSFPATMPVSSLENKTQINLSERENELSAYKDFETSEIEPNLTKTVMKTSDTQFLPKKVFSKNDKNLNDKKVAVVTPNQKPNQLDIIPTTCIQNPVKETITNRVHSTYILSPVKTGSNPIQSNSDSISIEGTISSSCEDSKDVKCRSYYLIRNIVQWNPKWLEEQAKNKKPPPVISLGGSPLPLIFSSYDTYIKSFYPMISLEIWESLYQESKPFWFKKEVKNAFYYKIKSNALKHSTIELQCESIVNANLSFLPCEGNIILLGFNEFGNGLENSLLGYIHRHKVENAYEMEKSEGWQKVPEEWHTNAKIWTFCVYIKKTKKNFPIGLVNIAYGIVNIKSKLQLADALGMFKDSPIQNDILRPTKEMFSFCKSISKIPRPQLIQIISEEIRKEKPHSKLILVNAPVGTGKTGAIIGIVEKLLFSNVSRIKLLLCAFSDLTVDEIGLRLVELNERCSWRGNSIKFVRFGQYENIPAKLQPYTLERKVLKMFKEQNKKEFQEREKELKVLEVKINDVLFKEQLKCNDKYRFRKSNDAELKQLLDQLQSLKENSLYKNIDPVIHSTYESAILSDSDVVLTTLNSCMYPQMRKFFNSCKGESHSCCIIDEISQCTELEVLQSLQPEINRLVLVGDLQQLPPHVSSKYAIKCGFKRSMMERILKLFSVQFSSTPPLSLVEQHRMQSQIFYFPSKYFYKQQLSTAAGVDERYKYSRLKPFVVYDILEKEMTNPSVNIEYSEPFIIANICAQFVQAMPTATLGVIVACEDLAAMYRIPLSQGNATLKEIEVNTVENYQGIEKDIIVISCINPSLFAENDNFLSSEKKMNVAITRARQSLVICGHLSSVVQFKHWTALINDAKERKNFISVSSLRQVPFVVMKSICRMG